MVIQHPFLKKEKKMNNTIYLITWVDSYSSTKMEWIPKDEVQEPTLMKCHSIGYIIKENKDVITVAPHTSNINDPDDISYSGIMVIPRCAIISFDILNLFNTKKKKK